MFQVVLSIIYLILVLGIIYIERKRPTEALLWVLTVVCIPYVGAVLYLIFGSTITMKITGALRKRRMQECHWEKINSDKRIRELKEQMDLSEQDLQVMRFNHTYNNSQITSYDTIQVFTDGKDNYKSLFHDIDQAHECIFIQFYTIEKDMIGRELVRRLTLKAQENVTVLVMFDFMANMTTLGSMFKPLKEAGGKVVRLKPYATNFRDHRKIVAIDHQISYIGGMNVGKKYAGFARKKSPWRDTQVRMEGDCVNILEQCFFADWVRGVNKREWKETWKEIRFDRRDTVFYPAHPCQFIMGGAESNEESVKMCYISMIRKAKKSIRIQTPYFVPDPSILDELKAAAASGVQIELMIPGIASSFFIDPVTTYYCGQLMNYDVKVYKYRGYIHAKTMIIDEELCCIGSVNMDIRSLIVNDEICGVYYDREFVHSYSEIFDKDIEHCREYTRRQFLKRGKLERLAEGIFLLTAPLF